MIEKNKLKYGEFINTSDRFSNRENVIGFDTFRIKVCRFASMFNAVHVTFVSYVCKDNIGENECDIKKVKPNRLWYLRNGYYEIFII